MSGNIGQIRVALRKDISPASYGTAQVEELRQSDPSGDDVLLIVKKFMADTDPIRVVVAVSALQAESLRQRFAQPEGVSPRRVIGRYLDTKTTAGVLFLFAPPHVGWSC